jgi:hypothetical protein
VSAKTRSPSRTAGSPGRSTWAVPTAHRCCSTGRPWRTGSPRGAPPASRSPPPLDLPGPETGERVGPSAHQGVDAAPRRLLATVAAMPARATLKTTV